MDDDSKLLRNLVEIANTANTDNLADVITRAVKITSGISQPLNKQLAEVHLRTLRNFASGADLGWKLTSSPVLLKSQLKDSEITQLLGILGVLHEVCYGFEKVEISSIIGWGGSAATRFYINSIYHYVSSLFLIDTSKQSHKGLPMGGTIIKALEPLELSFLLDPIRDILGRPFGDAITFGDAILRWRHSYLVHGNFSPYNVEDLIIKTDMRNPSKQNLLSEYGWDLFHQIIIFRLRIMALFTAANIKV